MKAIGRIVLGALLFGVAAVVGVYLVLQPPPPLEIPDAGVALSDVTLIHPGVSRREHRRLVVEGDKIREIGDATANSAGDPFTGMYVLPGLTDIHVHFPPPALPGSTELFAFLHLYHGVTAVRDAGDIDGTTSEPARSGIRSGAFPGPRTFSCGPFVDGDSPQWGNSLVATTPDEGRRAVEQIASSGYECIKIYDGLDLPTLDAIRSAAGKAGLPLIGHVPARVPYADARLDDAQHLIGWSAFVAEERGFPFVLRSWLATDDAHIDEMIAVSLEHGIANTPTLITIDRLVASQNRDRVVAEPDAQLLPRFFREVIWSPTSPTSAVSLMSDADFDMVRGALAVMKRALVRMVAAGVAVHSGTDSLVAFVVPGASLHRELRLFVDAGLTAEGALRISTEASARFLDAELGEVRIGGPAEFVIYREDPTRSLDALDSIAAVVRDGRLYTREALDAQLKRYRGHFDGPLYDAIVTPLVRRVLAATVPDPD